MVYSYTSIIVSLGHPVWQKPLIQYIIQTIGQKLLQFLITAYMPLA